MIITKRQFPRFLAEFLILVDNWAGMVFNQPLERRNDFSRSDIDRKANTRRRKRWLIRAMKRIPVVRSCSCGGRKRDLSRFAYQFRLPSPASPLGLPVFVRINYPRVSSRRAFRFRNRFYILLLLLVEIETLPFF